MKFRVLIAAICFILPCLSYLSADIYRWTDKQGTTHFGNSVPSDAQDVKVVSKEAGSGPAASAPAPEPDAKSTEDIIQELEDDLQLEREARKQADETKKPAPPDPGGHHHARKGASRKEDPGARAEAAGVFRLPAEQARADRLLRIPAAGADGEPGQLLQEPGAVRRQRPCARQRPIQLTRLEKGVEKQAESYRLIYIAFSEKCTYILTVSQIPMPHFVEPDKLP